jgi:uncharacterized membrane protein YoaK (UPF0700 family)
MSGIVSALADNLVIGETMLLVGGLSALVAFIAGAAASAMLINWGRRRQAHSEYAMPLLIEAALLLVFGFLGSNLEQHRVLFMPATVALLCFVMGLQNAIITKISKAEIRTTHVTGLVTDIGIELGKLFYWNLGEAHDGTAKVRADRARLRLLSSLLGMFVAGALAGAFGFKHAGFIATVPLATILVALAAVPVLDDLRSKSMRV